MMKVAEIIASTTLQNTADEYDKLAKERNEEGTNAQNESTIE